MLGLTIHAIGRAAGHAHYQPLFAEYQKRLGKTVRVEEWEIKKTLDPLSRQIAENAILLEQCSPASFVIALDSRGIAQTSEAFAARLAQIAEQGRPIVFLIGGSDGLTDAVRKRANLLISFGQLTWPHMLARAMLLEQLYRVHTIHVGHPYHK
jgi:23S rRNA (pseudouridine1915-N3)-methyltransferase